MFWKFILSVIAVILLSHVSYGHQHIWRWECKQKFCQKERIKPETKKHVVSLAVCRLFCHDYAGLWPRPTGEVKIDSMLSYVDPTKIKISTIKTRKPPNKLIDAAASRFKKIINKYVPTKFKSSIGNEIDILIDIADGSIKKLTLETDESYYLTIIPKTNGGVQVKIKSPTCFGSRHALETLSQLIVYDDIREELLISKAVNITDKPIYPYRGLLLDTARNYISVEGIKRTLEGMAASKLNTFHWHITDSQSFPFVSKSQPKLSQIGAYSPSQIYTPEDVADIAQLGRELGIRVMPEFDTPAHVGEGWQDTDFVICFNKQPWQNYCFEPPCGQLDPTKPGLYDVLEDIYKDMFEQFKPEIFHMGGDEVALDCWNSTDSIIKWMKAKGWGREEKYFFKLWSHFQSQALERVYKQAGKQIPVIVWANKLAMDVNVEKNLPKENYIFQIWSKSDDPTIKELLKKGYKLILSNYDALYLDCGFGNWVGDGNNWCSPYKGWQEIYLNSPAKIGGRFAKQFLGAEAALWTEQTDDSNLDSKLWPRAAALAERLWAEPNTSWRDAEQRMLVHRERLVKKGIQAESIEPKWCLQNEENCPEEGIFNKKKFELPQVHLPQDNFFEFTL